MGKFRGMMDRWRRDGVAAPSPGAGMMKPPMPTKPPTSAAPPPTDLQPQGEPGDFDAFLGNMFGKKDGAAATDPGPMPGPRRGVRRKPLQG